MAKRDRNQQGNAGRTFPAEILTRDEVRALVRACSGQAPTGLRNWALIVLLYRGGLRIAEALALHPKDVDRKAGTASYAQRRAPPPPPAAPAAPGAGPLAEEEIWRFAVRWAQGQNFFHANRWLGIQTLQNPLDAWITQEIIAEVKADFVVETGTRRGGSALLWATLLAQVKPQGRVLSVDIRDTAATARRRPLARSRIDFLIGSSIRRSSARLRAACRVAASS